MRDNWEKHQVHSEIGLIRVLGFYLKKSIFDNGEQTARRDWNSVW